MLQEFVSIKLKEGCSCSALLWLKSEFKSDTIEASSESSGTGRVVNFNLNCIHILKLFIKLSPIFKCAIRIDTNSQSETRDVTDLVLFVDVDRFTEAMEFGSQIACEEQFYTLIQMFKPNCKFFHVPCEISQVRRTGCSAEMHKAISWMHHVDSSEYMSYSHSVPIGNSGWFFDHKYMTFSRISTTEILRPFGYIVNTPSSVEKVKGIGCFLDTLPDSNVSPFICQKLWLVDSNATMVVVTNETFEMWSRNLPGNVIALKSLDQLTPLNMHAITLADVVLTTREFLTSVSYLEWLASKVEISHLLTLSAIRTFMRKMFYKRLALAHILPVIQGVKWRRVIIEDFNTLDLNITKSLCTDCIFGLSDMASAIPMHQIHNIVMPTYAASADILSRCVYGLWKESNTCEQRLIPVRTKSVTVPKGNSHFTWIHANVTLFSWLNYVPAWQRRKLLRALTLSQTHEYSVKQISKYAKKNAICPICFGTSNCMTSCGHHFCDTCLLGISASPVQSNSRVQEGVMQPYRVHKIRKQCPTCRGDIFRLFTSSSKLDTRLEKVIETCKSAMREGKSVVVFSQWEEIFSSLKSGLRRRRLEVDTMSIRFVKLCENSLPIGIQEDIAVFTHVPIFTSKMFVHHMLNRIRSTCKRVDVIFAKDTQEEAALNELCNTNGANWTIPDSE